MNFKIGPRCGKYLIKMQIFQLIIAALFHFFRSLCATLLKEDNKRTLLHPSRARVCLSPRATATGTFSPSDSSFPGASSKTSFCLKTWKIKDALPSRVVNQVCLLFSRLHKHLTHAQTHKCVHPDLGKKKHFHAWGGGQKEHLWSDYPNIHETNAVLFLHEYRELNNHTNMAIISTINL